MISFDVLYYNNTNDTNDTNNTVFLSSSALFVKSNFPKVLSKGIDYYLAGLWEGDGYIVLPSIDIHGILKNTPCMCITANYKQLPLFKVFEHEFGGWIRYKTKENAIVWTITAKADLLKIVTLINGKIRSPKLYQFNLLIDYVNKIFPSVQLIKHPVDCSSFFENYWLAGFIDANGNFKIRYTKGSVNLQTGRKTKQRIALSFTIEQHKNHLITNSSFEPFMKNIADFFTVNLRTSKHSKVEYWLVEVSSLSFMQILVKYLSVYPLLTTKRNNYSDFSKAFHIILANQHQTPEGKKTLLSLKNGMNRQRTVYNWDHLN
uniref:Hypothetical LAGLIDADG homing endonuclease n=1 Tax=Ourococcus multisporus TaxID=132186 RepID=A0A076VKL0_9CHLO|nr:hypothetical LAGLIDADG homing endonuclease [Ourococcus multisporus]AIK29171.1 hypothetical LAGLIDADG homing endonuclease [Ourococcus multisporus]